MAHAVQTTAAAVEYNRKGGMELSSVPPQTVDKMVTSENACDHFVYSLTHPKSI